jgi:hypothetical protein
MSSRYLFVEKAKEQKIGSNGQRYWDWYGVEADWCGMFVSYVADQAGILGKLVYSSGYAGEIPRQSMAQGWGTWYEASNSLFIPKAGDLILYDPWEDYPFTQDGVYYPDGGYRRPPFTDNNGIERDVYYSSHIGIIISDTDENGNFITIEGNTTHNGYYGDSGYVGSHTINKADYNAWHINGYYRPNWEERKWVSSPYWLGNGTDPFEPSDDQKNNAILLTRYFMSKGWTLEAICGMLGNMTYESSINPGVSCGATSTTPGTGPATGLVQWLYFEEEVKPWIKETYPDGNYPADYYNGDYQCARIQHEVLKGLMWGDYDWDGVYIPMEQSGIFSLKQFSEARGKTAYDLARYFLFHYEKPGFVGKSEQEKRGTTATTWYKFLSQCSEIYNVSPAVALSIEQPNAKQVIITGSTGGQIGKTKSIKIYYRWNSDNLNTEDSNTYDGCFDLPPQSTFKLSLKKHRLSRSIVIVLVQDNGDKYGKQKSIYKSALTPSYPCLYIKDANKNFVPYIPLIRDRDGVHIYVPVLKLKDGYYAIYNTDIEKISKEGG